MIFVFLAHSWSGNSFTVSRSNGNFEVFFFTEGGKPAGNQERSKPLEQRRETTTNLNHNNAEVTLLRGSVLLRQVTN